MFESRKKNNRNRHWMGFFDKRPNNSEKVSQHLLILTIFWNESPTSSLVKNDITPGVWIEKDRRTIGTSVAWVFLIRVTKIQKKGADTRSYWFLFFFNETPGSSLVKNGITLCVSIKKDRRAIWTEVARVFLIRGPTIQKKGANTCWYWWFFKNETPTSSLVDEEQSEQVLHVFS